MNDDLISRQAAIHACLDGWNKGYEEILADIRALPSAQPEIIRCRDCKHRYDDIGGSFCSFGVCVDCIVDPDFYCANAERGTDE